MNVLIIDDECNVHKTTSATLLSLGHNALSAYNGRQALNKLRGEPIDAVFLDLKLGQESGIDVFDQMREEGFSQPVIMATSYGSIETAVTATRKGVFDYVPKPLLRDEVRKSLCKLDDAIRLKSQVVDLNNKEMQKSSVITFDSRHPEVNRAYEIADRAAASEATILVLGPSGTGKSVLAQRIHQSSRRKDKPLVTVHCPSLSKELLESELFGHIQGAFTGAVRETWGKVAAADGGTLFLDEISDISMEIQAKLLRLIQEKAYERVGEIRTRNADTRIVAATNKDLALEVKQGRFREDLYYRLNVISLVMPSLAERTDDILPIAERYLAYYGHRLGKPPMKLSDEAKREFIRYSWPGNLRELSNVIERSVILSSGNVIEPSYLPPNLNHRNALNNGDSIRPGSPVTIDELEQEHILKIIGKARSLDEAATTLGIDTTTLYRKRKKMGLV